MEYIREVMVSSVALGVLSLACGSGPMSKYCKQIISLLMVIVVVFPFVKGTLEYTLPEKSEYGGEFTRESYEEFIAGCCEKEVEAETVRAAALYLGASEDDIEVDIVCDSSDISNIVIKEVSVGVKKGVDGERAAEYIKGLLLCENTVYIEEEENEENN